MKYAFIFIYLYYFIIIIHIYSTINTNSDDNLKNSALFASHVDVCTEFQDLVQGLDHRLSRNDGVMFSPVIQPAGVKLRIHL